jgi:hypothetical protein
MFSLHHLGDKTELMEVQGSLPTPEESTLATRIPWYCRHPTQCASPFPFMFHWQRSLGLAPPFYQLCLLVVLGYFYVWYVCCLTLSWLCGLCAFVDASPTAPFGIEQPSVQW